MEDDEVETPERPTTWRRVRRVAYVVLSLVILVPLAAFVVAYLVLDVRSPQEVLAGLDRTAGLAYTDGSEMMKVVPEDGDRLYVRYADVPPKLRDAIIAVEDPTFWQNEGFDPLGILRAAVTGVGGGSGITQQYIKNATGADQASYFRKFSELVLSTKLTQQRSKEEIFESYINIISFGRGTFGPASAANAYFGKPLADLTWSETAFLAGMIQSPSVHDPAASSHEHASRRWDYVAEKLVTRGYVSEAERAEMRYPGDVVVPPAETRAGRLTYSEYHVKRRVLAELESHGFGLDRLRQGGLRIETTLDRQAQADGEKAVAEQLAGQPNHLRAALVAVEPGSGAIRAYQGGNWGVRDYAGVPQPPGSAFHPFVVAAGLRQGENLDRKYPAPDRLDYGGRVVKNEAGCGAPECSVRDAVRGSVDTPFVEMTRRFGAVAVSQAARDAGIPADLDGTPTLREPDGVTIGPGIAVGAYPVRALDLASAYGTFAADGLRTQPYFVQRVLDDEGTVLWEHESTATPAIEPQVAAGVTEALRREDGVAKAGSHRFGDTGDNAGAWLAGYTDRLSTVVWVGADEERRLRDAANNRITGETLPAEIWRAFRR
ncbi:transglycosylase domain-containing protein [Amycolatopsis magusensis]|uniref:Membrane peptidoglycan carboxypeptidase n=1 Tax=Amycolatopsis magusensis TaxID=882444 RepID=A0ABS4Q4G6_9PSEU|nr:transglycosylase domain-containing protein [Amycolatopsis magusensis]MBP2186562.1 membrane peptidoglycan carboxypeptidase [Amycolatopsis magusensis]MDI5979628.1 transglycosylase domain-containing protein [Amycolatopsis magusensis]